ncbi:hypothetical protein L6E12_24215 [Actinokineospora sp. PR83]|nr:hypothetical protein [Actinokineospora sp. PR83]MCG8918888.1 hypothetical protein [Actinokineospora sp. PR83]
MTPESVSRITVGEQTATDLRPPLPAAGRAPEEAAMTVTDAMVDGTPR